MSSPSLSTPQGAGKLGGIGRQGGFLALRLAQFIALIGLILTLLQSAFLVLRGKQLCPTQGCKLVEELNPIPPLVFNMGGTVFFLLVLVLLYNPPAKLQHSSWRGQSLSLILLAAMAAEGVLIAVQYGAKAMCLYCLVIFILIISLTLLRGPVLLFKSLMFFAAVFSVAAFATPLGQQQKTHIDAGVFASREAAGAEQTSQAWLFFSSQCPHCVTVLAALNKETQLSLRLHPVAPLPSDFKAPGFVRSQTYAPEVNARFLRSLGLDSIPALYVRNPEGIQILQGEERILTYLTRGLEGKTSSSLPQHSPGANDHSVSQQQDSCGMEKECRPTP